MMNWATDRSLEAPVPTQSSPEQVVINIPPQEAMLTKVDEHFTQGDGFSIATLNLDHVVKIRLNPNFRAAYARHDYVVADGNPIVWLSRLAGQNVGLVPGSELIDPVIALAEKHQVPVGFVGSTENSLALATAELLRRYLGLIIATSISPAMGFDPAGQEADAAIEALAAAKVGLCLIALGAPKQEIFAARAQERFDTAGFISIGAGLDFISGEQTRAPAWVRAIAAEWLWRLLLSPARLMRRYGACFAILPGLTWTAWRARNASNKGEA